MALNLEDKKALVAEVAEVAAHAQSVVAAEYRGLTVANLKDLASSVQALSERLTPELDRLNEASQEAADHAARLSERRARAAEER